MLIIVDQQHRAPFALSPIPHGPRRRVPFFSRRMEEMLNKMCQSLNARISGIYGKWH
jgi:hypothetical protein